jgi:ribosomal protein S18 acetylase RimI-like enzyme
VGYADLGAQEENIWLDLRGLELEPLRALLDAIEARAVERKPDAGLIGFASEADQVVRELYDEAGYNLIRLSYRMEINLSQAPAKPQWPVGFTVRTMRPGEEQRVYEAHMTSFADAWMFEPEPFAIWSHWFLQDSAFDPSLWFLAEADDELAGIALTRVTENEPELGWVRILGVLPQFRRRGLAQALLRHTFAEHASRGLKRVGLGVDAESPTGAVRVYERAGMHVARTNQIFKKMVRGGE